MKYVFHERFLHTYTSDPAASPGRLEKAWELLRSRFTELAPEPAREEDILLVHTRSHLQRTQSSPNVYQMALLAAGATTKAAELCLEGKPAFSLCRPPGHHASPNSCWGFCYFNNIAIAARKLLRERKAENILIVDFDLHFGDGTANALEGESGITFYDVPGGNADAFLGNLEKFLEKTWADTVAVSAGFDRHRSDWGGMLKTEDYREIGKMLGNFAGQNSQNRLFAALEGGYNPSSLAESLLAFLEGLEEKR